MKQSEYIKTQWFADEGKTFVRLDDNFDMGEILCLGDSDKIENYVEQYKEGYGED